MVFVIFSWTLVRLYLYESKVEGKSSSLTEQADFAKSYQDEPRDSNIKELPLEQDLERFFSVYFNQKFSDPEKRLQFLQSEYERFGNKKVGSKKRDLYLRFFNTYKKIMKNPGQASALDQEWEVIYNQL